MAAASDDGIHPKQTYKQLISQIRGRIFTYIDHKETQALHNIVRPYVFIDVNNEEELIKKIDIYVVVLSCYGNHKFTFIIKKDDSYMYIFYGNNPFIEQHKVISKHDYIVSQATVMGLIDTYDIEHDYYGFGANHDIFLKHMSNRILIDYTNRKYCAYITIGKKQINIDANLYAHVNFLSTEPAGCNGGDICRGLDSIVHKIGNILLLIAPDIYVHLEDNSQFKTKSGLAYSTLVFRTIKNIYIDGTNIPRSIYSKYGFVLVPSAVEKITPIITKSVPYIQSLRKKIIDDEQLGAYIHNTEDPDMKEIKKIDNLEMTAKLDHMIKVFGLSSTKCTEKCKYNNVQEGGNVRFTKLYNDNKYLYEKLKIRMV